jgi:hypothetical protein
MSDWISVKEGLPKKEGHYLICYAGLDGEQTIESNRYGGLWIWSKRKDWYFNLSEYWFCKRNNKKITHWQPLPPPPSAEGKED